MRTREPLLVGGAVTVRADEAAPAYARLRHFTGPSHRFIKRIAALTGDRVCAQAGIVTINGARAARVRGLDSGGRVLPAWSGCRTLRAGEVFLLGDSDDSFDARYWGVIPARLIEAQWRPLWTWSSPQVQPR